MSSSSLKYVRHILDETEYLLKRAENLTQNDFGRNETLKRAFVRSLEVIGEATKNIPESFRQKYPDVRWRALAGMRDKLIHHYFGVDYEIVWDVVAHKIPELNEHLKQIIQSETNHQ